MIEKIRKFLQKIMPKSKEQIAIESTKKKSIQLLGLALINSRSDGKEYGVPRK